MPEDPTPPPAPEPTGLPAVPKQTRGLLNQAQLDALTKAEQIVLAALKPAHATSLTVGGIAGTFVTGLQTQCGQARTKAGQAIQKTSSKSGATKDEEAAKKALLKVIQTIQARARQKYFFSAPATLTDYYIGTDRIDANRPLLEQVSQAIIDKVATDTLPGVTDDVKTDLADARQEYVDTNAAQTDAQSEATDDRGDLKELLKAITQGRMTIQFAADAGWPWHDPASAGARKEFHLPPGTPFTG